MFDSDRQPDSGPPPFPALPAQDALAGAMLRSSAQPIAIVDGGRLRDVNDAFVAVSGYGREELLGADTRLLDSTQAPGRDLRQAVSEALHGEGEWRGTIRSRHKTGAVMTQQVTIARIDVTSNACIVVFANGDDPAAEPRQLAHYDPLTRLPNRYLIDERLQYSLRRAALRNLRLAVIFLDIDSFKNINDSLGHAVGDRLLRETARRLRETLHDDDHIGRIGGDEFLVVAEDLESPTAATRLAERLIGSLRAPITLNGREFTMTASLGISLYPEDGQSSEALMSHADAAMYSAKEQGRDTFRFYSQRMSRSAFSHILMDTALREAVGRNELHLTYQPQVALHGHRVIGLEVLLRWHHPHMGAMPPARFIPHAERTGLIRSIGEWTLRQSCLQGARWLAAGIEFGTLAVNVSAPQFRDRHFPITVRRILEETGMPPEYLELEITEGVLLRDTSELLQRMSQLHDMGVRFAIDDFGTGYSSLSYLRRMPIDRLKVDKSFVTDLTRDDNARIIADAVIALGRALDIRVLAEGIEDHKQEKLLRDMGCDEGQGYRFSMPLYADRIDPILRRRSLQLPLNGRAIRGRGEPPAESKAE